MKFLSLFLSIILASCASNSQLEQNVTVGKELKANRYQNLYFSATPSESDIEVMKNQGFAHIINLRVPSEHDETSERLASEKADIAYSNIPFPKDSPLSDNLIKKIDEAVNSHASEGKTLIHCSTGNRAAVWAGGYFHQSQGLKTEESMELAKKLGLTKEEAVKKLESYLEQSK